jgi:DNA-binding HxlR family transcriptional regulator
MRPMGMRPTSRAPNEGALWALVALLLERGPLRVSEIAEELAFNDRRLLSEHMQDLVADGLVVVGERRDDPGPAGPEHIVYAPTEEAAALGDARAWASAADQASRLTVAALPSRRPRRADGLVAIVAVAAMSAAITVAANAADWNRITLYVVLAIALAPFLLVALPIIAPPSRLQIIPTTPSEKAAVSDEAIIVASGAERGGATGGQDVSSASERRGRTTEGEYQSIRWPSSPGPAAASGSDVSSGTYTCTQCGYELNVGSRTHLPPCPSCGNTEWSTQSGAVHDPYPDQS